MGIKTLVCQQCGAEFEGYHNSKFCSDRCFNRSCHVRAHPNSRQYAPYIEQPRIIIRSYLDPTIKAMLVAAAAENNTTMGAMLEQVIIAGICADEYFKAKYMEVVSK